MAVANEISSLVDGMPPVLSAKEAAQVIGCSIHTLYDWRQRPERGNVPKNFFLKRGPRLYVRTKLIPALFRKG